MLKLRVIDLKTGPVEIDIQMTFEVDGKTVTATITNKSSAEEVAIALEQLAASLRA